MKYKQKRAGHSLDEEIILEIHYKNLRTLDLEWTHDCAILSSGFFIPKYVKSCKEGNHDKTGIFR